MKYISKIIILFILSMLIACNVENHTLYDGHDESLIFPTIDNNKIDIEKFKGKYLIVNYWATWCSPCIKELPELVKFNKMYSNKANIIGVNLEEGNSEEINAFVNKYKINYPNFNVDIIYRVLGLDIVGYPTTYVFNPKGELIKTIQGPVTTQILKQLIN